MAAKEEEPLFSPPLYKQRYQTAIDLARRLEARKVVDMGCAECSLVRLLKRETGVEEVVGVDVCLWQLLLQNHLVQPLILDHLHPRSRPLTVTLLHGSIAEPDARLVDFDLLTCIEVVEHLDPEILDKVPSTVFGSLRPKAAFFSTPNCEYNVLFPNFTGFRHPDHRFEWNRKQFQSWCVGITQLYGYSVEFGGLGEPPPGREELGHCTQTATFTRAEPHPSLPSAPQQVCSQPETPQRSKSKVQSSELSSAEEHCEASTVAVIGEPYTVVAEAEHPFDQQSAEEKLYHEAEYQLNVLLRLSQGDDNDDGGDSSDAKGAEKAIPLKDLMELPKIKALCSSVDKLREALRLSKLVKLDGPCAVLQLEMSSSSGEEEEEEEEEEGNSMADSGGVSHGGDVEFVPEEMWD